MCEVDRLSSPPRLREASFKVLRGEILGIAGLQGQGQAELFLSLFGARSHTGSVRVNGKQTRLRHPRAALAAGLALVPEDRATDGLCLDLSIRDNISIGSFGWIANGGLVSPRREQDLVTASAQRFKVKMRSARQEVSALSGGNQQKVLFARVLSHDPAVLMLLDATRGIDVGTKAEIYELMRSLCDKGVAILFYSSDVFELVNLADRVLVLHDGVIRAELVGDDIDESSIVAGIVGARRGEER